jgi:hypothetical protein
MDHQNHIMRSLIFMQLYHHSPIAKDHNNQFSRLGSFLPLYRHFLLVACIVYVDFVVHCVLGVKTVIVAIVVR